MDIKTFYFQNFSEFFLVIMYLTLNYLVTVCIFYRFFLDTSSLLSQCHFFSWVSYKGNGYSVKTPADFWDGIIIRALSCVVIEYCNKLREEGGAGIGGGRSKPHWEHLIS